MANDKKITEQELQHAAKTVLLKRQPQGAKYENRVPNKVELNQRFKLKRKRG